MLLMMIPMIFINLYYNPYKHPGYLPNSPNDCNHFFVFPSAFGLLSARAGIPHTYNVKRSRY